MAAITFKVPVYSGRVVVCTTHDDYSNLYHEYEEEPAGDIEESKGMSSRHNDKKRASESVYLVGVFDGCEGTLVHELVHTVFEMLTYSGIPITKRNDEVFAYLMDALYKESIAAMRPDANPSAV